MNKKDMTEQDIRTKYITPAIISAGWDRDLQIREEVSFTNGKVIVRRKIVKRGEKKRADYILYWKPNIPIAIVEAKDNKHSIGDGMEQALKYAEILDIPFVFTSNGDGFMFYDKTVQNGKVQTELSLDKFPSPNELWHKYKSFKNIDDEADKIVSQEYYFNPNNNRKPRYYQCNAINRTIEAIANGQNRVLLVMATGTGKTYTAFQIIYRLWRSRSKKRILFLADRNILVDDPMRKDFKFFNADTNNRKMIKIKNREANKAYEMYFAIYQGVTGKEGFSDTYKEFSPDFFDLIVVDECHRGSAKDNSAWRKILEYFKNATQIGMTATPKETKDISNIEYFGEPIYTYSLKQGIEDGFLAPYKVVRVGIDKDLEGYRPTKGKTDRYGYEIEDREYNVSDYDRNLVLEQRTELVMYKLNQTGRAAIVLPDGFLFGEGAKTKIKEKLLSEFNLHTIVRLPNGVFAPYTGINTNLLFFERGKTAEIWFYEHQLPEGYKNYTKTKPIKYDEFKAEKEWWNNRTKTDCAWKVSINEIKERNYNLDFKNPNKVENEKLFSTNELINRIFVSLGNTESILNKIKGAMKNEKC